MPRWTYRSLDEGAIDLHLADRQLLQIAERGVARAKVIQCQLYPLLIEILHQLQEFFTSRMVVSSVTSSTRLAAGIWWSIKALATSFNRLR